MGDICFLLALNAGILVAAIAALWCLRHPRRLLLKAERALESSQRWINAHRVRSALFVAALLLSTATSYYILQRQIDAAESNHKALLGDLYQLAIVFSPDGGAAHLSGGKTTATFARMDPINNLHLTEVIQSKRQGVGGDPMALYGFLGGDSDEIAHANMDEARRRIQIAKAQDDINDHKDYDYIEDNLLGLSYLAHSRPTLTQYLLWLLSPQRDIFEQYPVRRP